MAAHAKIIELRALLAERFPDPPTAAPQRLTTGVAAVDAIFGGGLRQGAITELVGPRLSGGSAWLMAAALNGCRDRWTALVDGTDSFDPQPLGPGRWARLLWVRCRAVADALRATDLLLHDGNMAVVWLDLRMNRATELRAVPTATWYRLQRLVEQSAAASALVVAVPAPLVVSAHERLIVRRQTGPEALQALDGTPAETAASLLIERHERRAAAAATAAAAAGVGGGQRRSA